LKSRRDWLTQAAGGLAWAAIPQSARAQTPLPAVPPRTNSSWPVFRGDAGLSGVGSPSLPDALKPIWTFEAESEPTSPVAADGRVFVATRDGDVLAIDLAAGKVLWRTKVEAGFESAPSCAVAEGLVLLPDLEGRIHAFAAADGKKAWMHETEAKSEIKASVAIASGVGVVGAYDGTLHALNLADGKRRWIYESEAQIHATCSIENGVAYVAGCDGHFRGLDLPTGNVKLDVRFGGYTAASPALGSGMAVFGTFSNDVVGIDLTRKAVAWRYTPKKQFPFYSSAAVADGLAYLGSRDKALHVLDVKTGTVRWTFDTLGKIDSSPVVAGSRVFFGSHDGRIRGVDVKTRKSVFSYEAGAPVATSPAVAANRLLVAATDGRILCFG
jgi:outer membrane protein assembly factor BamB